MADLTECLERLVDSEDGYLHNCEDCSDCERKNADAHLRATLLGHNVTVPIHEGEISLGQWQSILFAELDGPRPAHRYRSPDRSLSHSRPPTGVPAPQRVDHRGEPRTGFPGS